MMNFEYAKKSDAFRHRFFVGIGVVKSLDLWERLVTRRGEEYRLADFLVLAFLSFRVRFRVGLFLCGLAFLYRCPCFRFERCWAFA